RACHKGCKDGRCQHTCDDDDVKLIYVVDSANELLSFDPRQLPRDPFHKIGTIKCKRGSSAFSMSVDRNGTAWVVFDDGSLEKVSIQDASCEPTNFAPGAAGAYTFGMGFSTDQPGGEAEKLYISGNEAPSTLLSIDIDHTLVPHHIG